MTAKNREKRPSRAERLGGPVRAPPGQPASTHRPKMTAESSRHYNQVIMLHKTSIFHIKPHRHRFFRYGDIYRFLMLPGIEILKRIGLILF